MSRKDCRDCPDRYLNITEDGHIERCHTNCPIYAAKVEKNRKISEARKKNNDQRTFDISVKTKHINIGKHNQRKK